MVPGYIFFFIFALILYAYTNQYQQASATASAIRQILSGPCQLSCRTEDEDGLSGLSGLHDATRRQREGSECVCDQCPCGLIDDFLKTCRPATQMYSNTITSLSDYYLNIVETIQNTYDNICRVVECGASCRRGNMQLDSTVYQTTQGLSQNSNGSELKKIPQTNIISYSKDSRPEESTSKVQTAPMTESTETLKPWPENAVQSCSKCVEKGNICRRGCPKAVVKKKD